MTHVILSLGSLDLLPPLRDVYLETRHCDEEARLSLELLSAPTQLPGSRLIE